MYSSMMRDLASTIRKHERIIEACEQEIDRLNRSGKDAFGDYEIRKQRDALASATRELNRLRKIQDQLTPECTLDSLAALLPSFGPIMYLRQGSEKIGTLGLCEILGIMSNEALFVRTENTSELAIMWVDSTKEYRVNQKVWFAVVQHCGLQISVVPPSLQTTQKQFAMLMPVDDEQIKSAIAKAGAMPTTTKTGVMRTWTDRTGKFSVEAELIRTDGESVVLRRADGAHVNVPIDRLSDRDRQFLRK